MNQGTTVPFAIPHTGAAATVYEYLDGMDPRCLEYIQANVDAVFTGSSTNPALDIVLQSSMDADDIENDDATWVNLITFTQLTDTGSGNQSVSRSSGTEADTFFGRRLRLSITTETASGAETFTGRVNVNGR